MLAIVEQQEHPIVPKGGDQAGKQVSSMDFHAERSRYGTRHEVRICKRRQVDQPDAMFIIGDHVFRDGKGDSGLADASGSNDRHQPLA